MADDLNRTGKKQELFPETAQLKVQTNKADKNYTHIL